MSMRMVMEVESMTTGENADHLFSELDNPAFEEAITLATEKIMEQHRAENDDESLEIEDQPVRKPEGRPKGLKHTEESKAKMSVKRQARTQPRNTTSGRFVREG